MLAFYLQWGIPCLDISERQARAFPNLPEFRGRHEVRVCRTEGEFLDALRDGAAVALVWEFRQEWFALAPRLRAIFTPAAGRDYFRIAPPPGVSVHYGAFHGAIMGETALACVMAMSHGLLPRADSMRLLGGAVADPWPRVQMARTSRRIAGSTILILGFGKIGRAFARMALPFGPRVIGVSRTAHPELDAEMPEVRTATYGRLDSLLPEADHVVCFLPSSAETDDIIDARRISLMRDTAVVYNFGRGNAVDEESLAAALREGRLAGAVLDVFKKEPLPADSPLRSAPNCFIYPHASAFSPDYLDIYLGMEAGEMAALDVRD
ncbi:MAG: D-2-hydroxyacid dehydrogenase [Kiritimatiellae bacterium]|nr:D-2-hydroxyacid dehydrogenase [Kiritimatiellia bacterium]